MSSKKSNKNTKQSVQQLQRQIANLQRTIGSNERAAPNPTQPKVVYKPSPNKNEADLAGKVLRMMLDPCHAEPVCFPDEYSGRSVLIRSASRFNFTLDSEGNRGIAVFPLSKDKVAFSGNTPSPGFSVWTYNDDSQQSELASAQYQYIRQVAMCATVKPIMPTTDTAPEVRSWCGPHLSVSARSAAGVGFDDKPFKAFQTRADAEQAWCAREAKNFVPFDATTMPGSSTTVIDGSKTQNVPAIHFSCRAGSAAAPCVLEVVAVYECFYSESAQFKPGVESPTNYNAVGMVINGIKQVKFDRSGDAIGKVTSYANKVYSFMQRPEVQAAWSVGKTVAKLGLALI